MTTIVTRVAPVLHLPVRRSTQPAPVRDCDYCELPFEPTRDPANGNLLWDVDERGNHCCDDCHCAKCMTGHHPDQDCPSAPDPADPIAAREEAAVYGDPDALYDALTDTCLDDRD